MRYDWLAPDLLRVVFPARPTTPRDIDELLEHLVAGLKGNRHLRVFYDLRAMAPTDEDMRLYIGRRFRLMEDTMGVGVGMPAAVAFLCGNEHQAYRLRQSLSFMRMDMPYHIALHESEAERFLAQYVRQPSDSSGTGSGLRP